MYKILIVSPDFPYPANHGGRKDIWERLKVFARLGYDVDLLVTVSENVTQDNITIVKQYCSNLIIIERNFGINKLFSIFPFQYKTRELIRSVTFKKEYDFIICEGEYVLSILENLTLSGLEKVILRMHNDEVKYSMELMKSEKNIIKQIYFLSESMKCRFLKMKYNKKLKNIWFISADEKREYEAKNGKLNGIFLPPHVPAKSFKEKELLNNKVLFIGSLFMVNNKEAITWYIENIHDKVSRSISDYSLTIAGNSRNEGIEWLLDVVDNCDHKDNIEIYDTPKSLNELYANCSVFINPMQHGAGVKLKTIEAIQKGLAVVSTLVGSEGTGLVDKEHIFVGKSADDFLDKLCQLLNDNSEKMRLINSSQSYISREFESSSKIDNYLNLLKSKAEN